MTSDDRLGQARYCALADRVYGEPRMPAGTRDLILALGWVTLRDPRRHDPTLDLWARARDILNADDAHVVRLIAADAPRYEIDWHAGPQGCQAPMARAGQLCGRGTVYGFTESDPVTGWATSWGFCGRARCRPYLETTHRRAAASHEAAPKPIPNKGGLLPLFFQFNWERRYLHATKQVGPFHWSPPVYGLSADEWPEAPGQDPPQAFPKLRLIAADGELIPAARPRLL
ncbi:hypothetical protein ACFC1B_07075 [Streptomyces xiamenensis]|uniref:hypothetical protein n=1 Tax=Streptomyces xiamenensis TaxID=408015 RepID=UPI0035DB7E2D